MTGDAPPYLHHAMGEGREFDLIRSLIGRWGPLARGIGDDAAVLHPRTDSAVVVSTDACVQDVHFRDGWLSPFEIGVRAMSAALSDIAAMGAHADAVLLSFVLPDRWRTMVGDLADGIGTVVGAANARIVGGNVSAGATFSITSTVLGSSIGNARTLVSRDGAVDGDVLLMTGLLGGPGQALAAWERQRAPEAWARARFAAPTPRLAVGQLCARAGAHAMLDVSDGLAADARHLAAASGVRLTIDTSRLPCGPGVSPRDALVSGEEYELLIACAASEADKLAQDITRQTHVAVTAIGRVAAADGARAGVDFIGLSDTAQDGVTRDVEFVHGHDHLSS